MHILLVLLASMTIASGQAETKAYQDVVDRIVETALAGKTDHRLLKELSALGPRLSGYPGYLAAVSWAESTLKTIGCDRVWRQPVTVPYWRRGPVETAEIVGSAKFTGRSLAIAALGGSPGTAGKPLTGGVIEVNPYTQLEQLDSLVRDRIVFFNEPYDHRILRTFEAYSKAVRQRSEGPVAAAKLGAAAAIVRSVTSRDDNVPHVGGVHRDSLVKPIPAVAIGVTDAEFLSSALQLDPDLQIELNLSCENLGAAQSYNVIGEIRGSIYPDEIIVVGGHLDSWDKGHGAHDDGAGCIQSMAVLGLFKKLKIKPKRTIRCVLFAEEERRQSGANAYAARSDSLKEQHFAAIESDRGAFTPRGFYVESDSAITQGVQKFLPYLQSAGIDWIRKGGSGANISKINNIKAKIGYVPDDQRYFDFHHSDNDTFDTVNPRELALGTAAIAVLTYLISEAGIE